MRVPLVRRSLTWKLLAAQLAVIVAGSATLALVALSMGPSIFHRHVRDALGFVPPAVMQHLDDAFGQALWLSLAVGIAAATVTAATVSWVVAIRIVRPVRDLAAAARDVSRGNYSGRVDVGGSDEVTVLGRAFNEMAASLSSAEERRRQLLSDVAHELRTPLATIDAYLEGLADGVVEPGPETWKLLRSETGRLGRLTEDVARVSRAEERQLDLRLQRIAAGSLLERAAQAAAPAFAAKGVRLETTFGGGRLDVEVDVDRLGEVLANLLENALRHTPVGGTVTVDARRDVRDVLLSVADSGEGLASETLERVFERFYRVDRARSRNQGGTGIGLAIARALVEAHGGALWAESPGLGGGSRFVCRLPVAA
jgi:two-component system sensor histidine kinase BaeS